MKEKGKKKKKNDNTKEKDLKKGQKE